MEKEKQIEEMAKEYGEVKKKIIDILTEILRWEPYYFISRGIVYENDLPKIADALIEAGIGDMKEAEAEANRYEMLYMLQGRDMALAERRAHDAEHHAKVAERALINEIKSRIKMTGDNASLVYVYYGHAINQAEKELAEERKDD